MCGLLSCRDDDDDGADYGDGGGGGVWRKVMVTY